MVLTTPTRASCVIVVVIRVPGRSRLPTNLGRATRRPVSRNVCRRTGHEDPLQRTRTVEPVGTLASRSRVKTVPLGPVRPNHWSWTLGMTTISSGVLTLISTVSIADASPPASARNETLSSPGEFAV